MHFDEKFKQYMQKVNKIQSQLNDLSEESTKTTLIMPFFAMLGYDVFDSNEFLPEFTCDVAGKKGEKVDYAILKDGEPVILIEVKRAGMKLQKQQQAQLFRYFSTNRCRIAILTNGITYQFFSDLNAPNVMDEEPFLSFNILEDDSTIYLESVRQFCKEEFDIKHVISKAVYQKYAKVVEKTLQQDLIVPSDELVKYFLSRPEIKTGARITSHMIEKYREITQKSMQKVLGATIKNIVVTESAPVQPAPEPEYEYEIISEPVPVQIEETEPEQETIVTEEVIEEAIEETDEDVAIEEEKAPATLESISEAITDFAESLIQDFSCKQEDAPDFLRLHLYTTGNQKLGAVKIIKNDLSIQFRKFENGIPTTYDLSLAEDIKNYL